MISEKQDIRLLELQDIEIFVEKIGEKKFRAKQVFEWLWNKNVNTFSEMKNVPKELIAELENSFLLEHLTIQDQQTSSDGTIKFALKTKDDCLIESVLIPTDTRATICVSTQTGCSLNCKFCATAKIKSPKNLTAGEIYDQIFLLSKFSEEHLNKKLTNIVYMGMGEPLLNYENTLTSIKHVNNSFGFSPSRITVSTAGIIKKIKQLADDETKFNLAISLHSANDKKRNYLMPINKTNNLKSLAEALKYYNKKTNNRITIEYLLLKDINDSTNDAKELALFCKNFPCKINIIEYNPVKGISFSKALVSKQNEFVSCLKNKNIIVNVRNSRGSDINAACGQLANIIKKRKSVQ